MDSSVPSWARVGAKVVCVDGSDTGGNAAPLERGGVYQIRHVRTGTYRGRPAVGVSLVGIRNKIRPNGNENAYHINRFRPLVSQADDISTHFAHHLDTRAPELV